MPQCDSFKVNGSQCSRPAFWKVIRRADGYIIECLCQQHAAAVALTGLAADLTVCRMQAGDVPSGPR